MRMASTCVPGPTGPETRDMTTKARRPADAADADEPDYALLPAP
jgi:hypothetical protein